jgi:hypothetical protein
MSHIQTYKKAIKLINTKYSARDLGGKKVVNWQLNEQKYNCITSFVQSYWLK